ncbi:hypothetical protein H0H81_009421 [Sphagnurus paluster]|uniref:Uncharacterized protein n=1 Tax=Sphagnurus paluster TaxID=117069 RepID=A0A9P7KL36_9AGAR|nr:hypothetical protein H0H81_009421 [Sphagnurus paluster]
MVHFTIQLSFQIRAFTVNADAARFLNNIVVQGNAVDASLPILRGNVLYMCSWVPANLDLYNCPVVWNGTKGANAVGTPADDPLHASRPEYASVDPVDTNIASEPITSLPSTISTSSTTSQLATPTTIVVKTTITPLSLPDVVTVFVPPARATPAIDDDGVTINFRSLKRETPQIEAFQEAGQTKVNISGIGFSNGPATLDQNCVWSLNWPVSVLNNTKREDIVFIAFQFWVLGMSIVALLNESIPHILASLVTHTMASGWAAFQITHTANFRADFNRVVTNGTCDATSLLPNYWERRGTAEITSLALNIVALLISAFLTWKLIKLFGWQTFKRVGASRTINRVYKIVLILSITIQLSLFFMVVSVSLWVDQLFSSTIGDLTSFQKLYKVSSFITLVGWFAVRKELSAPMFVFLLLSVMYLGAWGSMFFSTTFRWTFVTWKFFSIIFSASVFLTVASLVLGVICRCNFGKGLLRYLNAQQALPEEDFAYYNGQDIEKVDFPSNEKPIPTYSETFGSGPDVSPPSQMFTTRGPRFFNTSAPPFETGSPISPPPNAHTITRKVSDGSSHGGTVQRSDTRGSDKSFGSLNSYYTYGSRGHSRSDSQKRWVIE